MRSSSEDKQKIKNSTLVIRAVFWTLVAVFVVVVSSIIIARYIPEFRGDLFLYTFIPAGTIFFLLGIALIVLPLKVKIEGKIKKYLILVGSSSVGVFVSIMLHNFVYGIFVYFFGESFWERIGIGDEPFFFIIGLVICPIALIVGMIGSIVLFTKRRRIA